MLLDNVLGNLASNFPAKKYLSFFNPNRKAAGG
jgi:hypothetical protein